MDGQGALVGSSRAVIAAIDGGLSGRAAAGAIVYAAGVIVSMDPLTKGATAPTRVARVQELG